MKIRVQKGGLAESMETVKDIEPTQEAIAEYLREQWGGLGYGVRPEAITVTWYCHDSRIDWETYLVCLDGDAVAYTDGPLENKNPSPSLFIDDEPPLMSGHEPETTCWGCEKCYVPNPKFKGYK